MVEPVKLDVLDCPRMVDAGRARDPSRYSSTAGVGRRVTYSCTNCGCASSHCSTSTASPLADPPFHGSDKDLCSKRITDGEAGGVTVGTYRM